MREGMARVVPVPLLSLFTGHELETMVRPMVTISICLRFLETSFADRGFEGAAPDLWTRIPIATRQCFGRILQTFNHLMFYLSFELRIFITIYFTN